MSCGSSMRYNAESCLGRDQPNMARVVGRLHFAAALAQVPFSLQSFLNSAPIVCGLEKNACLIFCEVDFSLFPGPALCHSCV